MEFKKEVKDLGVSNVQLDVVVDKKDVKEAYDKVVAKYVKEAHIPGFRKGKVPASVLEQKFGDVLRGEASMDLIETALEEIFKTDDVNIKPLNYEQAELVGEPKLEPNADFAFAVKYDVFPKIELTKTEGFTLKVPEITDLDEQLEKELKQIQLNNSFVLDKKEGAVEEKGDLVTIDYWEADDESKLIEGTKREDFAFEVGTGMNLYKIDEDILGMKKDEEKTFAKEYATDFENEELAGKKVNLVVKLKSLKYRDIPALDDELAQDVSEKYKTLADLKADVKGKIEREVEATIRAAKMAEFLNATIKENPFVLPESMVKAHSELQWGDFARQFGMTAENFERVMAKEGNYTKEAFIENSRARSELELKQRLITDELSKLFPDIVATAEDFDNEIKTLAEAHGLPEENVQKQFEAPQQKQYLQQIIKERKLFDSLFEKCKTEKGEKIKAVDLFENAGHQH